MQCDQQLDLEAWKDLLLRRELEAINQASTLRALIARIQELEANQRSTGSEPDTTPTAP